LFFPSHVFGEVASGLPDKEMSGLPP